MITDIVTNNILYAHAVLYAYGFPTLTNEIRRIRQWKARARSTFWSAAGPKLL